MRLLLVRHGPAGDRAKWSARGRPDAERPLTEDGRRKTRKVARGLARVAPAVGVVASSPFLRARQTADILARSFPKARRELLPELSPGGDRAKLLERLAAVKGGAAAWIGHEPDLPRLAAWLCSGGEEPFLELKKAGACLLEFDGAARPGTGRLAWLLKPAQLRRLGR